MSTNLCRRYETEKDLFDAVVDSVRDEVADAKDRVQCSTLDEYGREREVKLCVWSW